MFLAILKLALATQMQERQTLFTHIRAFFRGCRRAVSLDAFAARFEKSIRTFLRHASYQILTQAAHCFLFCWSVITVVVDLYISRRMDHINLHLENNKTEKFRPFMPQLFKKDFAVQHTYRHVQTGWNQCYVWMLVTMTHGFYDFRTRRQTRGISHPEVPHSDQLNYECNSTTLKSTFWLNSPWTPNCQSLNNFRYYRFNWKPPQE